MTLKRYTVEVKPKAKKAIRKFPRHIQEKADAAIAELADDPWPARWDCSKALPKPPTWRIKLGRGHRLVYTVDKKAKHIVIYKASTREEAW